ncbi:MAG: ABC transporter permease [Anaerolineae bacterium]|nr:ABC transporter permease [Anaerolineae bacterium]
MLSVIHQLFARSLAILRIAAKRVVAQRGLALATLIGLIIAIGLTISIPLYAESVYYNVLSEGFFSDAPRYQGDGLRPPVSLLFRYTGSFTGPKEWEDVVPLNIYFEEEVYRYLKLSPSPEAPAAQLFNTGLFGFFPERDVGAVTDKAPDFQVGLAAMHNPEIHLSLIEGRYPTAATSPEEPFEILVSKYLAEKMGIQTGEIYLAYDLRAMRRHEDNPAKLQMRVAGVWEPTDPKAEFWEYAQLAVDNMLFVSEDTFADTVSPALSDEIYQALWYLPLDASSIYVSDVDPTLSRLRYLEIGIDDVLSSTTMDISPVKVLERYREAANLLSLLMMTFSVPVISLVVTFIGLVVALSVERQHSEIAVLRSRGATPRQVLGIATVESGLLGLIALVAALPVGLGLAYLIGRTRSFLDFSLVSSTRIGLTWSTVGVGAVALLFTLFIQLLPLIGITRHTIVTYKSERARRLKPPWWQRAGVDLWLILPAGYGTYLLSQQGSILANVEDAADPLQKPLLFLLPALSLLVGTLIVLRILPPLMRAVAWACQLTRSTGVLLAARQLSRAPGLYAAPLALLILTLSLSTYAASLAATLDNHLHDQQHYWVGADASLVDMGETINAPSPSGPGVTTAAGDQMWRFLPVMEYVKLPGVDAAGRVGRYRGLIQTSNGHVGGTYMGIDRAEFAQVAFWRDDFATESLGKLMNLLALRNDAVLLPREFMEENYLNVGDTINIAVAAYDTLSTMPTIIVGSFDYFPGWYPDTGPLAVGNLDNFFLEAHAQLPYRVWMKVSDDIVIDQLSDDLWEMNFGAQALVSTSSRILREQLKPERQGLLGLLSVGFSAAALLTALGFVLYALFSFRRRAVELGVLRAIGLSTSQMSTFVATELALLLAVGGGVGTALGIWASKTYIPYLQIGGSVTARVPPFAVEIAWPALLRIYALFALLFVVALAILVRALKRMQLFQAIKLGETV